MRGRAEHRRRHDGAPTSTSSSLPPPPARRALAATAAQTVTTSTAADAAATAAAPTIAAHRWRLCRPSLQIAWRRGPPRSFLRPSSPAAAGGQMIPPSAATGGGAPSFCRVREHRRPADDSRTGHGVDGEEDGRIRWGGPRATGWSRGWGGANGHRIGDGSHGDFCAFAKWRLGGASRRLGNRKRLRRASG